MNSLRPLILITPCIIPRLLWTCLRISYPRSYHAIIGKWKIKKNTQAQVINTKWFLSWSIHFLHNRVVIASYHCCWHNLKLELTALRLYLSFAREILTRTISLTFLCRYVIPQFLRFLCFYTNGSFTIDFSTPTLTENKHPT
jgi:hypothetical protein